MESLSQLMRIALCIGTVPRKPKLKIDLKMINPNVIMVDVKSLMNFLNTEEGRLKSGN